MEQRNPLPTADVLIEVDRRGIVLVQRKYPPPGWAIPGGFIDAGETAEDAAIREALEETGLEVELTELLGVYSDPSRDPRHHTLTVVFIGRSTGIPLAGDDAAEARVFHPESLPDPMAFDHHRILSDYVRYRQTGERPEPRPLRPPPLGSLRRRALLRIARETIRARLLGTPPPGAPNDERLDLPGQAFVSLHVDGQLRGCIGSFETDRPLHRMVRDLAIAAAEEDPRFPPIEAGELADLEIEVSVLGPRRRVAADAVVAGIHGVAVEREGRRGVLLPQVARHERWTREQLLDHACVKAGLEPTAWRDPRTEIFVFTAEVFGEEAPAAAGAPN